MVELLWGAFVRVGQVGHAERNHDAHITQFSHLKCLSLVVTEQVMVSLLIKSRAGREPSGEALQEPNTGGMGRLACHRGTSQDVGCGTD